MRILKVLGLLALSIGLFLSASALIFTEIAHLRLGETLFLVGLCLIFVTPRTFLTYAIILRKQLLEMTEEEAQLTGIFSPSTNKKLTYLYAVGFVVVAFSLIMFSISHSRTWLYLFLGCVLLVLPQRLFILRLIEMREASKQTASESGDEGVGTQMPAGKFVLNLIPTFMYLLGTSITFFGGVYTSIFLRNPLYAMLGAACSVLLFLSSRRAVRKFVAESGKLAVS